MAELQMRVVLPVLFVNVVLAMTVGYVAETTSEGLAAVVSSVCLLAFVALTRVANIELGWSGTSVKQVAVESAGALLLNVGPVVFWFHQYMLPVAAQSVPLIWAVATNAAIAGKLGVRGMSVIWSCMMILRAIQRVYDVFPRLDETMQSYRSSSLACTFCILALLSSNLACYRRDQCSVLTAGVLMAWSVVVGSDLAVGSSVVCAVDFMAEILLCFTYLLWLSRHRRLAPGLCDCKFLRLDYLRRMVAEGEPIRRCQELPPEAFGNPSKARYLVVVSHRWLDHRSCDVHTEAYPHGFRLHLLLEQLERHFSPESVDAAGRPVLRTPEEERIFRECLPNMATLYSMFPVLISAEVPEGLEPYEVSGWCFSEATIAALGCQLLPFSPHARQHLHLPRPSGNDFWEDGKDFHSLLASKSFCKEEDRAVVLGIVHHFMLKARLASAVRSGDCSELRALLAQLPARTRQTLLDQPVDKELNTLLHLAVQLNCVDAVLALLKYGARPHLRNLRGDKPFQWFLLPRCTRAAWTLWHPPPPDPAATSSSRQSETAEVATLCSIITNKSSVLPGLEDTSAVSVVLDVGALEGFIGYQAEDLVKGVA